jgi:hypothetical protein
MQNDNDKSKVILKKMASGQITKPDYSDAGIFWVRIDNLIDSLALPVITPYFGWQEPL